MQLQFATETIVVLVLGAIRAAVWLVVCPPFNTKSIPGRIKALLGFAIALAMLDLLRAQAPAMTASALVVSAVEQVLVGAALGFVTYLVLSAVQMAGDLIDLFGGFAVAFAFDPQSFSGGNSVFGKFYGLLATTLLLVTDGHQLVIRGFAGSYQALPLNETLSLGTLGRMLTGGLGALFVAALQIAGPLIAVLFCADLGLGLLSRVAPALNAFSLGFPAKIMLTLSLAGVAILVLPQAVDGLVQVAVREIVGLTGG